MTEPAGDAGATESSNVLDWPDASDIGDEVFEETTETETADEPAEETSEEAPAEETTEEPAEEAAPPVETFDREYVEKLRSEAAEHRVRAKEANEAFEGFDEPTRAEFLDMARGLNDPDRHVEVAQKFYDVAKRVFDHYGIETPEMVPDPNRPLTPKQLEDRLQQEREERDLAEQTRILDAEIKSLGYETGTPDHFALMRMAWAREDGSIQEAHKAVEAWKKGIITEWAKHFQEKQDRHLDTAPQVGLAPAEAPAEDPTTFEGARERMNQMFKDQA
jgi:hypothetical protein